MDLLFAQEHNLPIITVNGEGTSCNSDKVPKLLCNSTPITCVANDVIGSINGNSSTSECVHSYEL